MPDKKNYSDFLKSIEKKLLDTEEAFILIKKSDAFKGGLFMINKVACINRSGCDSSSNIRCTNTSEQCDNSTNSSKCITLNPNPNPTII